MRFVFNEQKAAEAAAHLLQMAGGSTYYMKLLKLMYLADREALVETGFTITGDRLVSMDRGPVLSAVYDRVKNEPGHSENAPWFEFVSAPAGWRVWAIQRPPEAGELSDFEIDILRRTFDRYGRMDRFALVELVHQLPEWHDPHGGSVTIDPADILRHAGKTEQEVAEMAAEAEHMWFVDRLAT